MLTGLEAHATRPERVASFSGQTESLARGLTMNVTWIIECPKHFVDSLHPVPTVRLRHISNGKWAETLRRRVEVIEPACVGSPRN